jgi:hypothetical protein
MRADSPARSDRPVRSSRTKRTFGQRLYVSLWKRLNILGGPVVALVRAVERGLGPSCVPVFLMPVVGLDFVRRLVDYGEFKRLRTILPEAFWRGMRPGRHLFIAAQNWDSVLTAAFFSDRLGEPGWAQRVRVRGTRPEQLPEFGRRPLILVHLHTGAYGFLHYWLRAQRLRATCYWAGDPMIFRTAWAQRIFARADRVHGLEDVPQMFLPHQLRAAFRFLVPGHILTLAMDAESSTWTPFDANGHEIWLSQGVVHLAEASGALLVPVSVVNEGVARFEIRFGTPVPDALVDRRNPRPAMQFMLDQLWPDAEEEPSRVGWNSLLTLDSRSKPNHIPWP